MITPQEEHIDILKEIINIGVGKAAGMLNEMINAHIKLQVPAIKIFLFNDLEKELGDLAQQNLSAVRLKFHGAYSGSSSLVFPPESALKLVKLITEEESFSDDFDSLKVGALSEIGNILLNGVMGSLGNILEEKIEYSIPAYLEGNITNVLAVDICDPNTTILLVQTRFLVENHLIVGDVILFFEVGSFGNFIEALSKLS